MSVDDIADFSKQRRNLIIISGVLILHDVLGVNYEDFKVFGMKITQGENITWVIWTMWAYFFVRYFNLFFEQPRKYKYFIAETYKTQLYKHYSKKFQKKYPEVNGSFNINHDFKKFFRHHMTYCHPKETEKSITYHVNWKRFYFDCKTFIISLWKNKAFFEYYFPIIFGLSPLLTLMHKALCVFVS
jgi:hypothetical protein